MVPSNAQKIGSQNNSEDWIDKLLQVGLAVQRQVRLEMHRGSDDLARPVAQEGGDTIFALDRCVEEVIDRTVRSWPEEVMPLLLIAEGINAEGHKRYGDDSRPLRFRIIIDPIDGTRNLMYDKRSGWFVAAVTSGEATTLADAFASVLVELPTSKQGWADVLTATTQRPSTGKRLRLEGSEAVELPLRPSRAETLRGGFGQVVNFFPGTKVLAAELMERIAFETLGESAARDACIFEDQYLSTAGQMVELIQGKDRFCCDLRPLLNHKQNIEGLCCHPYDMAGALVAQRAGVILTDGLGQALRLPLDVFHPVHWCGYANAALRDRIAPVLAAWFREKGIP